MDILIPFCSANCNLCAVSSIAISPWRCKLEPFFSVRKYDSCIRSCIIQHKEASWARTVICLAFSRPTATGDWFRIFLLWRYKLNWRSFFNCKSNFFKYISLYLHCLILLTAKFIIDFSLDRILVVKYYLECHLNFYIYISLQCIYICEDKDKLLKNGKYKVFENPQTTYTIFISVSRNILLFFFQTQYILIIFLKLCFYFQLHFFKCKYVKNKNQNTI